MPAEKVRKVLKIAKEPISLETPIGEEEDSHLGDFIEDKKIQSPSDAVINMNLQEQTRKILATLTPREEKVLRMRFGIGEKSDHTLEEVGQDFFVTRERIRQIEAKALRKLRHPTRSRKLSSFVEGNPVESTVAPDTAGSTQFTASTARAGAIALFTTVSLGAFGAHGLEKAVTPERLQTFFNRGGLSFHPRPWAICLWPGAAPTEKTDG